MEEGDTAGGPNNGNGHYWHKGGANYFDGGGGDLDALRAWCNNADKARGEVVWRRRFFFSSRLICPHKDAPPMEIRRPESSSRIQNLQNLKTIVACCLPYPSYHLHPGSQSRAGGMAHDHNAHHYASRLPLPTLSF